MDDQGPVNPQNGVAPYINAQDVILTVTPFVSASTNDYRLNNEPVVEPPVAGMAPR